MRYAMPTKKKKLLLRIPLCVLLALSLTACVTGTRNIALDVPSHEASTTVEGTIYIESIEDSRTFEQKPSDPSTPSVKGDLSQETPETLSTYIGRQRNGYGKAMGSVKLPNGTTIQDEMRRILVEGLQARGYSITQDSAAPITLAVDVTKFWGWFTPGVFSVTFASHVDSTLQFTKGGQTRTVEVGGRAENRGAVASDANWALAFSRAFSNYLQDLDSALTEVGL